MLINVHSISNLITNSSTTTYTYSDESPAACIEMINEIFKTLGINKKCEDIFLITVLADDCVYEKWNHDKDEDEDEDEDEDIEKLLEDIKAGRVQKPSWMIKAEEQEDEYEYRPDTQMYISVKDPQFEKLAELVLKFLYSTETIASGEG